MQLATNYIIINTFLILAAFVMLIKGSDYFVDSAAFFARKYNVSEMVIGLTIVSIGTSLPELGTNVYASAVGENAIAMGNVVGSNIANICLVLGIGGLLAGKIIVNKSVMSRDGLYMIFVFIILFLTALISPGSSPASGYMGRFDGVILLFLFALYMIMIVKNLRIHPEEGGEASEHLKEYNNIYTALSILIIGLVSIFLGAKILVDNVVWCAVKLNIPQGIIAATIVAFGTSVPELAVTVTGALKGRHDIAVGNIVGSCIFNITLILGISLIIRPLAVSFSMLYIVIPIMIISGIILLALVWKNNALNRTSSSILLLIYTLFVLYTVSHIL